MSRTGRRDRVAEPRRGSAATSRHGPARGRKAQRGGCSMKWSLVLLTILGLACLSVAPAWAQRLAKGNSMVWVGLNGNRAQTVGPSAAFLDTIDEAGIHVAVSRFLSDAWAGIVSGGVDAGRIRYEPPSGPEFKI